MATYTLTNTAKQIDDAVQAVTGADTSPQPNSANMVTSGGVYSAINNLSIANLAGSALVTESEGIANNDNDGSIPTSAAVKDYVDNAAVQTRVVVPPASFNLTVTTSLDVSGSFFTGSSGTLAVFSYDIPEGYTATSLQFYGASLQAYVFSNAVNSSTVTQIGSFLITQGTGINTGTIDFTDTASTTLRYITLRINRGQASSGTCYGARIFISKI